MGSRLVFAMVSVCWTTMPSAAFATSETDCARQWKGADGNGDGMVAGPEADRYLAYYQVRTKVAPVGGRIARDDFMRACMNDDFKTKPNATASPLKGASSFTETQARDRAIAAGFERVSALVKDDDGVWRGTALKDGRSVSIAIDYKGNVLGE